MRLAAAGLLGGLIGYEREIRAKDAGIRTHFLVALGSCLFMLISQYGFAGAAHFDASRVAAQVVSGIGFIGVGIIMARKNFVRGLTTAAGLWVVAAIGMGIGGGLYEVCTVATVLVILCLEFMHYYKVKIGERPVPIVLSATDEKAILAVMQELGKKMEHFSITREGERLRLETTLRVPRREKFNAMVVRLSSFPGVTLESLG